MAPGKQATRRRAGPSLGNRVRSVRAGSGLSQQDLARRARLTRQAVNSIEAGRYVPNTSAALRLAGALGCAVEDLFYLDDTPRERRVYAAAPVEGASTRAAIARVDDRLVAHPLTAGRALQEGFASADGVLLGAGQHPAARLLVEPHRLERTALLLGCDPSLGVLASHLGRRRPDTRLAWLPATSRQALDTVSRGEAHIAGSHLRDPDGEECNVAHARKALGARGGLVMAFASWEQGLVVASGNPKGIRSVADLGGPGVRLVNREVGAGTRQLLDDLLQRDGVPTERVRGYGHEVASHLAVSRAVATGAGDAGVALRAAADVYGLAFIPLSQVRFDLVIPRGVLDHPALGVLLDLLQGRALREEVGALPGYDVREMGAVVADMPATTRGR